MPNGPGFSAFETSWKAVGFTVRRPGIAVEFSEVRISTLPSTPCGSGSASSAVVENGLTARLRPRVIGLSGASSVAMGISA